MHAHEKWRLRNLKIMKKDPVNLLLEMVKKSLELFGNHQTKKLETITLPPAENLRKLQKMQVH